VGNENRVVPVDFDFAQYLDLNCTVCENKYADNTGQHRTLERRKRSHPEETQVMEAFLARCNWCFDNSRNFPDSPDTIQATLSCLYRGNEQG